MTLTNTDRIQNKMTEKVSISYWAPGVGKLSLSQHFSGDDEALLEERLDALIGPFQQTHDNGRL